MAERFLAVHTATPKFFWDRSLTHNGSVSSVLETASYTHIMQLVKQVIKRTFAYRLIKRSRERKVSRLWTTQDQKMLMFYAEFVQHGTLCFDVGANVGNRVKIFLKLGANVVAVEPQSECAGTLRAVYGKIGKLSVVDKALGDSEGKAEIMISNAPILSSLSPEWVQAVRRSGRFSQQNWDRSEVVEVTTLDRLIEQYGVPSFIKIDVEGFEYEVIRGLSQPVKSLSLEFTPEFLDSAFKCLDHLQRLGDIRLNYSIGESMQLALGQWVTLSEITDLVEEFRNDHELFGDIYVRFL
jgi:FkbM family methyltransferase